MRLPRPISDERGFTIVEVMVAAALLLTGLVGTMSMLNSANAATTSTKAREQGVSLQRELTEARDRCPTPSSPRSQSSAACKPWTGSATTMAAPPSTRSAAAGSPTP